MAILKLEDVKYKFEGNNRYALKDINIEFEEGKIYSIIGQAGSGKSTLLSIISGLDNCTEGNIFYKDKNLKNINLDIYRSNNIGTIFREYNFIKNATVLDNIFMSMNLKRGTEKVKKQFIYNIMNELGIDKNKLNYKSEKLSYTDCMILSIVRVISNNTDIIVIDDITEDIDEKTEIYIMDIMKNLAHKHNKCIIISTNSKCVTSYADEIWGLNNGTLMYIKSK